MSETDRHDIGGNFPPTPAETAAEETRAQLEPFADRRDAFVASMGKVAIRDRASAGAAADLLGLARGFHDKIVEIRREQTEPLQEAIRSVIAVVSNWLDPLSVAAGNRDLPPGHEANAGTVWGKIHDFEKLSADRARAQREEQRAEETRLRDLAADPAPDVAQEPAHQPVADPVDAPGRAKIVYGEPSERPAAAHSDVGGGVRVADPEVTSAPIRGDYGFTLGKQRKLDISIEDVTKVPREFLDNPKVHAAIVSVVRSLVNNGVKVAGVKAVERQVSSVRG